MVFTIVVSTCFCNKLFPWIGEGNVESPGTILGPGGLLLLCNKRRQKRWTPSELSNYCKWLLLQMVLLLGCSILKIIMILSMFTLFSIVCKRQGRHMDHAQCYFPSVGVQCLFLFYIQLRKKLVVKLKIQNLWYNSVSYKKTAYGSRPNVLMRVWMSFQILCHHSVGLLHTFKLYGAIFLLWRLKYTHTQL